MSAIEKLEQRLAALESELAQMKDELKREKEPWWKAWMGAFENDPYFEQAMKYGQEWRKGKKPATPKKKRKSTNDRP
jgi:hypothetical protein